MARYQVNINASKRACQFIGLLLMIFSRLIWKEQLLKLNNTSFKKVDFSKSYSKLKMGQEEFTEANRDQFFAM